MSASITYDKDRNAFVLAGIAGEDNYRLLVPQDLLDDELGAEASEETRRDWIESNLASILSAYTARADGGWVKAPWNRILVEEVN